MKYNHFRFQLHNRQIGTLGAINMRCIYQAKVILCLKIQHMCTFEDQKHWQYLYRQTKQYTSLVIRVCANNSLISYQDLSLCFYPLVTFKGKEIYTDISEAHGMESNRRYMCSLFVYRGSISITL